MRRKHQIPKTESKSKRHKKNKNEINSDFKEMDSLLNKMTENNTKTTSFRIFKYYQENNYQGIPYDDILSNLSNEYKLNPNNFLNASEKPFKSLKKFITSLKSSLRNNAFQIIMKKNKKYLTLDLPKAIEYLINFNNKNVKIEISEDDSKYENNTSNNSDEILFDVKKIKSNQFNNSDNLIGKKRRRKIIKTEVDQDDYAKEITSIDSNSRNNSFVFEKGRKSKNKNKKTYSKHKKKSINKNRNKIRGYSPDNNDNNNSIKTAVQNNKIFLEGIPLNANLSSYSFCGGNTDSVKIISKSNSSNYLSNFDGLYQNEDKLEVLYKNKEEENAYITLKNEINPIINGFNQIKNKIEESEENIYSISKVISTMEYIFSEYKTIKSKLLNDSNTLKTNFDSLDNEIKILNLCKNSGDIPFKDEIFSMHHNYAKRILNFCQTIIEENNKKITKLSDYDFNFSFCKLSVETKFKEIIENKSELLSVINFENIINPDLINYFKNISNESKINERRNEVNIIFINNIKLKNRCDEYVKKIDVYTKNLNTDKKS